LRAIRFLDAGIRQAGVTPCETKLPKGAFVKQFEAPARAPDAARFCDGLKFNRFHALLISLCIVTLLFDGYYSQIISYVIPGMTRQWQLTPMQAGYVGSYGLVGLMIGAVALGILGDRMGRKIPLMLGLFLFSFFGGLLYWAPDFSTFCILRFLSGLGVGGVLTLTITLATEFAPSNIRATMVTTMVTGLMLGPFCRPDFDSPRPRVWLAHRPLACVHSASASSGAAPLHARVDPLSRAEGTL
jgi:hypothetical protein